MNLTELRNYSKTDPVILSIFAYQQACSQHLYSIPNWNEDQISQEISAELFIRYKGVIEQYSFEQYLDKIFSLIEEYMPTISGLHEQDAIRICHWCAETILDLAKAAHHSMFKAHCTILQKNYNNLPPNKR